MSRVSQARSLGKYFLLVDNMLVVLGFFVVFPLISIRFVDQMGWAALMVGIALGLRQLVQQGLGIFGGAIADRLGAKPMIVTGMLMRAGGFAAMAVAHEPWVLWLSCILSGLGGTLFDPPRAALVVKLVRPHQRGRFFSLLMMQDSAGAVIGALLGSWLLQYDFRLVCSAGAALADARARGSYMGFSRLGLAFGGALGYAGGGWLFDAGKAVGQPELPWLMLGAIGFITFLALWWQFSPKRSASGMLEPRT
ncbi:MFS transporter [Klebsiella variicola]|uniref:MFS transporter n=1 Tax=Klebsiella variicola TaxID=244366 RepID=UPI003528BFB6